MTENTEARPRFFGDAGQWSCSKCGVMNHELRKRCNTCGTSKQQVDWKIIAGELMDLVDKLGPPTGGDWRNRSRLAEIRALLGRRPGKATVMDPLLPRS